MRNISAFFVLLLFILPLGIYFVKSSGYSPMIFCVTLFAVATLTYIFLQEEDLNFEADFYVRWIIF